MSFQLQRHPSTICRGYFTCDSSSSPNSLQNFHIRRESGNTLWPESLCICFAVKYAFMNRDQTCVLHALFMKPCPIVLNTFFKSHFPVANCSINFILKLRFINYIINEILQWFRIFECTLLKYAIMNSVFKVLQVRWGTRKSCNNRGLVIIESSLTYTFSWKSL